MLITSKNAIKVANSLYKKEQLTKNEKVFLKFFSIYNFLAQAGYAFNLKTISMHDIKFLSVVKNFKKLKKLKRGQFYLDNFYYNFFIGNLKGIVISKSGYIKIFENSIAQKFNLSIGGTNIFENSVVVNKPNLTIFLNKNFKLKFKYNGKKLSIISSKKIDNFNSNFYELMLSNNVDFTLSKAGLSAANLLLLGCCKQTKNALKRNLNGLNGNIYLNCEIFSAQTLQNYINFKQASLMLNFLDFNIFVEPLMLGDVDFLAQNTQTKNAIILRQSFGVNCFIKQNFFNINFVDNSFFCSSILSRAVFKMPLVAGEYKIVNLSNGLKIVNTTQNFVFFITHECKLESAQILNFELVLIFSGQIKFVVSNTQKTWKNFSPHVELSLIQLENALCENMLLTLLTQANSFYNLTKIDELFYAKLKQIVKNRQSVRYAAARIIELANTAKREEVKKLFKLNALLSRLPERKANLTDLLAKQTISLSEINELSLEEQLELYNIRLSQVSKKQNTIKLLEKIKKTC